MQKSRDRGLYTRETFTQPSTLKTRKITRFFVSCRLENVNIFNIMLHEVRPYCFNISHMSLIRKNDLEYYVEGGDVKLVSKENTGLWRLFFSRQQKAEACFSEKKEAVSTDTTSSLLSPVRDSIEPQKKSFRKKLYPFQTPLVASPSQSEDTSLHVLLFLSLKPHH